jgi:hypothetical protein
LVFTWPKMLPSSNGFGVRKMGRQQKCLKATCLVKFCPNLRKNNELKRFEHRRYLKIRPRKNSGRDLIAHFLKNRKVHFCARNTCRMKKCSVMDTPSNGLNNRISGAKTGWGVTFGHIVAIFRKVPKSTKSGTQHEN